MVKKLVGAMAVGVFLVAGLAVDANAFSQPIGTKISLIKPLKLYKIVSKPTLLFPLPTTDLTATGGLVTVTANGESLTCNLAAQAYNGTEGWKGLGSPAGSTGWKYTNNLAPGGGIAGACKLVLIKEKVIKVLAKGTGGLVVLGPELNSDVGMQLDAGSDGYCALATPPHSKEVAGSLLKMKDEPAPGDCGPFRPCADTYPTCNGTCPPDTECRDVGAECECVEVDFFPNSLAEVDIRFPCGSEVPHIVQLQGPTDVHVLLGRVADTDGDGREQVPTEIVAMELTGRSPSFGDLAVRLRDPAQDPYQPTTGEIEESENKVPGQLDLPPFNPQGEPTDSFFDVFFEVELLEFPPQGLTLHNHDPKHMRATISHKPPAPGEAYENPDFIDLFTEHGAEDPDCFAQIGPGWHVPNPTTTTTTIETTTTTSSTTTTTLGPCDCSGFDFWGFETSIGSGTAGTLRKYRCSGGDPDFLYDACDPDLGDADCDFGPCYVGPNFCAGDFAITCTSNEQCQGTCQEISGGDLPLALKRGGLYIGGGLAGVPLPIRIPDKGLNVLNVSGSSTLTLTATTPAQIGQQQCTQGRTCSNNPAQHCVLNADCGAGTCLDNCLFGPPMPIPIAGTPALSLCAVNVVDEDSIGTAECDGGDIDVAMPLRSAMYLNGDLLSSSRPPDLPGVQPCPLCVRICSGGLEDGLPCRPDNPNRACMGGLKVGKPCTSNSDCPNPPNPDATCLPARTELSDCLNGGGTCQTDSECLGGENDGAACTPATSTSDLLGDAQDSYPTSHDCLMDSWQNITASIGGLPMNFSLTSGAKNVDATDRANGERVFCGFCRDVTDGGSLCFEGDKSGSCPPSIPAATGNAVPCTSDADCADADTYESCVQRDPGAFGEAGATRIELQGQTDGQCLGDGTPHNAVLVSPFCVPPSFNAVLDGAYFSLPGPGAALLFGNAQLY